MPVGGPIYFSAAEAIRAANADITLIGVDKDIFVSDPDLGDLVLTSVLKNIDAAVYDVVTQAAEGNFDNSLYVGNLENNGVGLAPFHDYEASVDPELQAQIDELIAQIISGELVVESPATPGQ